MGDRMRGGGATPEDQVPGDLTTTNDRGGVVGLLRSGSFIAKVSPLAQIFMSKFDDLIRVVSRTFERFSDAVMRVEVNNKGKVYQYTEYYRSSESSIDGVADYYEVVGHVEAGEEARDNYLEVDVSGVNGETLLKHVVPEKYEHMLTTAGHSKTRVFSGAESAVEEVSPGEWKFTVGSSTFNVKAEEIEATTPKLSIVVNGEASITVNGNATTTITGNEIKTVQGNSNEIVMGNKTVVVLGDAMETAVGAWTIAGNPTVVP